MDFRSIRRLVAALSLSSLHGLVAAQGVYSVAGPWEDDTSSTFHLENLQGRYTVMTMAYGACQRVCSTSVRKIQELHRLAEVRHVALDFVVFGLDPSSDRPSDWAAFRLRNRLSYQDLNFLSGSREATRRMAARLGIRYWKYGEHTVHDFRIVLVSPGGRVIRSLDHFDDDLATLLP
jgi:cytochrome oxidase Cu insertion factor (SCO1/SenC/PrrC family)